MTVHFDFFKNNYCYKLSSVFFRGNFLLFVNCYNFEKNMRKEKRKL